VGPGVVGLRLPPPEVIERLNLSEAQRTKLDDLLDTERRKTIRTEGDLRIAELDLQKRVESDKPDTDAIDEAIARLGGLRTELLKARVATLVAFRGLLTTDQRSKLRRPPPGTRWH
jgi:Spy/CpxP family protein refolding chaperone